MRRGRAVATSKEYPAPRPEHVGSAGTPIRSEMCVTGMRSVYEDSASGSDSRVCFPHLRLSSLSETLLESVVWVACCDVGGQRMRKSLAYPLRPLQCGGGWRQWKTCFSSREPNQRLACSHVTVHGAASALLSLSTHNATNSTTGDAKRQVQEGKSGCTQEFREPRIQRLGSGCLVDCPGDAAFCPMRTSPELQHDENQTNTQITPF